MAELKRLEKWKNALNSCIRCGYCYEHCPIFKSTRWEIDAPRGKLVLLFGLLQKEVKPSEYLTGKLFECFHCRCCEKACSSGVPTLDVFKDARADLLDAGFKAVGTTSVTDNDICAHCLNCVRMCKHEARSFEDGKIVTDRLKCQGCGNCYDICSAKAVFMKETYDTSPDDLNRQMRTFLKDPDNPQAKAIVFACSWSSYPGFQTACFDTEKLLEHQVLVTACTGRLKAQQVLQALELGAWGVLVTVCPEDDCDHGGSERTKIRISRLQKLLEGTGVDPSRIKVSEVAKAAPRAFSDEVSTFMEELRTLGPLDAGSK